MGFSSETMTAIRILVWVVPIALLVVGYKFWLRIFGIVIIPEDALGLVNKKFKLLGGNRTLPDGAIIALRGEAGVQANTLSPGVHFWLWPWQYEVIRQRFLAIPQGQVGMVEARDGHPLSNGRILGREVPCDSFQNARAFLEHDGERGPQLALIPPGTYRINTELFTVMLAPTIDIEDNKVGIVTTKEGQPLSTGEIAGRQVEGHNGYQNAQAFVTAGGFKGLQEQVILAGRYFINPRFATVEIQDMTQVPIANVGVVIAYVGEPGADVSGDAFRHGNLVARGRKGVWNEPLDPGKYPINPFTHKVEVVPTANVVLNWATGKTEAHNLDKNLSTITVRSSDGFKFNLDVSQIIHIPRNDAPKVIARFGNMMNLVTQVLEPTIGNYFRNTAQSSDVIDFLRSRTERQSDAKARIAAALSDYNVGAVDTLIGDITPPDSLMKTLTDRKLAEQERVTYKTQEQAEAVRRELQQAKAMADTQATVVAAERTVAIKEFEAQAAVKAAEGQARSKTTIAEADAMVVRTVGVAEADKVKAIGTAEADVLKMKTEYLQPSNYTAIQVSQALATSGKLVPEIVAGGGSDGGGRTLVDVLVASFLKDHMNGAK